MRARTLCAAALSVAAVAVVVCGGPAEASLAESSLVITANDGAMITEVILRCGPAGGTHADAENACAALAGVDGDFDALPEQPVACLLIYQPVTVEVGGNWRNRVVRFERQYPNRCVAGAQSAGVFVFDTTKHS
jgi:hypothetical protein